MKCVNLDLNSKKALVAIRKKRGVGFDLIDIDSEHGRRWINQNLGRKVQVQYRGSCDPLAFLTVTRSFSYNLLHQTFS